MKQLRKSIHDILEVSQIKGSWSWHFDISLTALILLNVVAIILESIQGLYNEYEQFFTAFVIFLLLIILQISLAVFSNPLLCLFNLSLILEVRPT